MAVAEGGTVTVTETTRGRTGPHVEHVACAIDCTDDKTFRGKWAVDNSVTGNIGHPALLRCLSGWISNYRCLNSERGYVPSKSGENTLRGTDYGDIVGTVYTDEGGEVNVYTPDAQIVPDLGWCLRFKTTPTKRNSK